MIKPIIYSTPTCVYCHALMDWLDSEGVEYEEMDTTNPVVAHEISQQLGYEIDTVPTTVIGDEVIVGFNRPAIKKALARVALRGKDGDKKD
jgi:glutaredoxin